METEAHVWLDGFAPASIVAPLGTVAILCNALIAPLVFHETFRLRDFMGIVFSTIGAVTIVLSANPQEEKVLKRAPYFYKVEQNTADWVVFPRGYLGGNYGDSFLNLLYNVLCRGTFLNRLISSSRREKHHHRPWPSGNFRYPPSRCRLSH